VPGAGKAIFPEMKTFKIFFVLAVLAVLAGLGYYLFGSYSDGNRAGTVMKLSRKGLLFKTYEGELNLGMVLNDNSGASVSNVWEFSVPASNQEALDKLDTALARGHRAKLHYREMFTKVPWRGDTKYLVYKVELAP
jgi:hypothetical protein